MAIYKTDKVTLNYTRDVSAGRDWLEFSERGFELATLDLEQARHVWALLDRVLTDKEKTGVKVQADGRG